MEKNTGSAMFKFLRFCRWAVASVYCAATIVFVLVLRFPLWHAQLDRLVYRTWLVFVAEKVGSTTAGFVNYFLLAIATLIIGLAGVWLFEGFGAMRKNILETIAIGFVGLVTALFLVFGTQFVWGIVKSGYADHQALAVKANAPKPVCPTCPGCPTCPPPKIVEHKTPQSSEVRVFPISHFGKDGVPKMEYVLTSEKDRTPVEIVANCDFPIEDLHVAFLSRSGGYISQSSKESISPTSFRVTITSPIWAPSVPLFATVIFGGSVDRMPSCNFVVP